MASRDITLNQAVDEAVDTLPFFRRALTRARLGIPRVRNAAMMELQNAMQHDQEMVALCAPMVLSMDGEGFTADTPFAIDVDKLDQLLQLILKYLPSILELIMKLFAPMVAFLLCSLTLPASAQDMICANGQCVLRQAAQSVVRVATAPVRYAAVSSVQGYGSSGSAASQSYGSAGSASFSYTPFRPFRNMAARANARQASRAAAMAASYGSGGSQMVAPIEVIQLSAAPSSGCQCVDCQCPQLPESSPPLEMKVKPIHFIDKNRNVADEYVYWK